MKSSHKKNRIQKLGFVAFVGLLALYIFQVHSMTSFAYTISRLEGEASEVKGDNKSLQLAGSSMNSFENLAQLAEDQHFEKVRNITYIQILEGPVARVSARSNE